MNPTQDEWITTHDAARELLSYATIGASVIIEPIWPPSPAARQWALVLDAAPQDTPSRGEVYSLPCRAADLARRARTLASDAYAALNRRRTAVALET